MKKNLSLGVIIKIEKYPLRLKNYKNKVNDINNSEQALKRLQQ